MILPIINDAHQTVLSNQVSIRLQKGCLVLKSIHALSLWAFELLHAPFKSFEFNDKWTSIVSGLWWLPGVLEVFGKLGTTNQAVIAKILTRVSSVKDAYYQHRPFQRLATQYHTCLLFTSWFCDEQWTNVFVTMNRCFCVNSILSDLPKVSTIRGTIIAELNVNTRNKLHSKVQLRQFKL